MPPRSKDVLLYFFFLCVATVTSKQREQVTMLNRPHCEKNFFFSPCVHCALSPLLSVLPFPRNVLPAFRELVKETRKRVCPLYTVNAHGSALGEAETVSSRRRDPPNGHIGAPWKGASRIPLWRLRRRTPLCPRSQAAPSSPPPHRPPTERTASGHHAEHPLHAPLLRNHSKRKAWRARTTATTTQHRPGSGRSRERK